MIYLVIVLMLAVLGVLFTGIFGMVQGGAFNRKYGNRLMQMRVALQALALLAILAMIAVQAD